MAIMAMVVSAGMIQAQSPLDDTDHDRFPDIYETQLSGNATNPAITPDTSHANFITVNPAVPTSVPNRTYTTIQAAINAIPTNAYGIVWVKAGTYQEGIDITNRRVLLISEQGGGPAIIKPIASINYNYGTLGINAGAQDSVIDGFIFDPGFNSITGVRYQSSGVAINLATSDQNAAVNNCLMRGQYSSINGDGIYVRTGTAWVTHCTIADNVSPSGSGIYVFYGGRLRLRNSIVWHSNANISQVAVYVNSGLTNQIQVTSSIVRGGLFGSNPNDPLLRANNHDIANSASPACDSGSPLNDSNGVTLLGASGYDLRGQLRSLLTPDMGAYEFTDTDADGLPDWWETQYFGGLTQGATTDYDTDTLTNSSEYLINTSPVLTDTDSDGASDSQEVTATTNPLAVDTDLDGMTDGYEILYSLNPLDALDTLEDADGDRVPNLFEYSLGQTNPLDALVRPAATFTVDPAIVTETATTKKTITNAVNAYAASGNTKAIIEVKNGTYLEALTLSKAGLLLLGEASFRPTSISANTAATTIQVNRENIVIDGFRITHSSDLYQGRGINLTLPASPVSPQAKIINCQIVDNLTNNTAGIYCGYGTLTLANNLIALNTGLYGPHGVYVGASAKLRFQNNIIWNPPLNKLVPLTNSQVYAPTVIGTSNKNIIYGGEFGASSADPLIDWDFRLRLGSPAINPIGSLPGAAVPTKDIQGESRDSVPDYGADEFVDTDADGLGDKWELAFFASLATTNADGDPDSDGLFNKWESLLDLNPAVADTDGNGLSDLRDALISVHEVYTDTASRTDADADGWSAIQELLLGTSDTTADSNGDGVSDTLAVRLGIALTGTDPDGDGLTTAQEATLGTSPFLKDTDGDGVVDGSDAFPLDPSRSTLSPVSGDVTAPGITLLKPSNATLIP